jgi:hypothetical protein
VSWFKRQFGLDAVDTAIHVMATFFLAGMASTVSTHNSEGLALFIGGASTVLYGVRRQLALRRRGTMAETTGEAAALHVAELEARVAELELAQHRVMELEERLDFAERMLARQPDSARLTAGGD